MTQYKERHVYFGTCGNCHKRFQSYKRKRIKQVTCRKCRKFLVNKDQIPLFGIPSYYGFKAVVTKREEVNTA